MACLIITLTKRLKGPKCLGLLFEGVYMNYPMFWKQKAGGYLMVTGCYSKWPLLLIIWLQYFQFNCRRIEIRFSSHILKWENKSIKIAPSHKDKTRIYGSSHKYMAGRICVQYDVYDLLNTHWISNLNFLHWQFVCVWQL